MTLPRIPKCASEVSRAAALEHGRYALAGIKVETGQLRSGDGAGVTLTATDGRALIRAEYNGAPADTPAASIVVDARDFARALKHCAGRYKPTDPDASSVSVRISADASIGLILTGPDGSTELSGLDAHYPNADDVIPPVGRAVTYAGPLGFDPALLASTAGIVGKASRASGVAMRHGTEKDPVRLDSYAGTDTSKPYATVYGGYPAETPAGVVVGVIMPRVLPDSEAK